MDLTRPMCPRSRQVILVLALCLLLAGGIGARGEARLEETVREFLVTDPAVSGDNAKHQGTVITIENARIVAEMAPDAGGNIIRYGAKGSEDGPFCRLDDNFSACGAWQPQPYTHRIDERGPQRAAVTFLGGGTLTPFAVPDSAAKPAPTELDIARTMSIDGDSTRLRVDVTITNRGQAVVPAFRYMAHAVYSYKTLPGSTVYAFMPTVTGIVLLDHELIVKGNIVAQQAPAGHPFRKWSSPGARLDKARYPGLGWLAMFSDSGHSYLFYDPAQFEFVSFWSGTHPAEWLTLEPHTKAVDLKPGQSVAFSFSLALRAEDVPLVGSTLLFEPPVVAECAEAGGRLEFRIRGTTVRDRPEASEIRFKLEDAGGKVVFDESAGGALKPFLPTEIAEQWKLLDTLPAGRYLWSAATAEDVALGAGTLEVLAPAEFAKRQADAAVPRAPLPDDSVFPPPLWTNSIGMQFVRIPVGEFIMGSAADDPQAQPDEKPAHKVRITRTFLMAKYEVTNAQFRRCRPGHHSQADFWHVLKKPVMDGDDQPALTTHNILPAAEFCAWLNRADTAKPAGWEYRLPTEAEWEYAARGPADRRYPWGNSWDSARCRFGDQALALANSATGTPGTAVVGSFSPAGDSPFGVCDLAGNVWEWCQDFYDPEFYRTSPTDDPVSRREIKGSNLVGEDSEVEKHVLRGGSWGSLPESCRAAFRYMPCSTHAPTLGIRVVLAPVIAAPR